MMKHIIIHAGSHKTGSSSIQHALSQLKTISGYTYPIFEFNGKPINNHSIVIYNLFGHWRNYHINVKAQFTPSELECEREELKKQLVTFLSSEDDLILSGEDISSLNKNQLNEFYQFICSFGPVKIDLVLYIRNPVSMKVSNIQELIKAGDNYETAKTKVLQSKNDINAQIEKFEAVYSNEKLHFLPFEREVETHESIVRSFLNIFKFDKQVDESILGTFVNESISHEVLEFYSYLNGKEPLFYKSGKLNPNRQVNDFTLFKLNNGKRFALKPADYDALISQSEADCGTYAALFSAEPFELVNKKGQSYWGNETVNSFIDIINQCSSFYRYMLAKFFLERKPGLEAKLGKVSINLKLLLLLERLHKNVKFSLFDSLNYFIGEFSDSVISEGDIVKALLNCNYVIEDKVKYINLLRDYSVKIENQSLGLALQLMAKAKLLRPNGPFISEKLICLEKRLADEK